MTLQPGTEQLVAEVAAAASDALAEDIVGIDVTGVLPFSDAFVIVTADNPRHLRGVRSAVQDEVHAALGRSPRVEGDENSDWLLLDYGDVVVHIFLPEARDYYALDSLWGRSPRVFLNLAAKIN
ncbi:ribosome silencing factor [Actinomyces minihominis]|uniref:ribosome silencing factor n=1 Tax=Actinomyces minihominis TaxID=2002838 RepID=UPI000C06CD5B|nr:ribosome silencing factor [Actinomyces minihominis]